MKTKIETPKDAVNALTEAGWSFQAIANETGMVKSSIFKIGAGTIPNFLTGKQLVGMARRNRKPPRKTR